ncbi:hypothetical protein LINPERPRIM_LOCUS32312, partial [Linum perenne]
LSRGNTHLSGNFIHNTITTSTRVKKDTSIVVIMKWLCNIFWQAQGEGLGTDGRISQEVVLDSLVESDGLLSSALDHCLVSFITFSVIVVSCLANTSITNSLNLHLVHH